MLLLAWRAIRVCAAGAVPSNDSVSSKRAPITHYRGLKLSQLALLYICVLYRPRSTAENLGVSSRPLGFWQWTNYSQHIEFLAGYMYVGI